jgi:mannose-1-phosphate guanylyltransferase/mannose-1-phosphate guanylyltransferase/mannose-6-phosphate isomerase
MAETTQMIPVVLSGGSGTRLWPVSRPTLPKQFADLFDESLLAKTLRRLSRFGAPEVIASADTRVLTLKVLEELDLPTERAIFEPVGRNTAPAVALACRRLMAEGRGSEVVGVFPADHLVADDDAFARVVALAVGAAEVGEVVTLGVRPTAPETGYGYIEVTDEVVVDDGDLEARRVRAFREKPDLDTARAYVASGDFLWNAGMFVFRADVMADAFARLMPETWQAISTLEPADLAADADPATGRLAEVYASLDGQSIDYGIMEHLERQASIPCSIGWSDVGSWDELARLGPEPPADQVFQVSSSGNFVLPHGDRVVGLVGVDDLVVADTADALLVARRGAGQGVKELVAAVAAAGRTQATEHPFEVRPWGRFEILRDTDDFKSKVIVVEPGQRLSYQSHRHREEHWVIVSGHPVVTLDGERLELAPRQHVHIPLGAKHRIENPGAEPVVFVEVQLGDSFAEDDIVRYEDDYRRV